MKDLGDEQMRTGVPANMRREGPLGGRGRRCRQPSDGLEVRPKRGAGRAAEDDRAPGKLQAKNSSRSTQWRRREKMNDDAAGGAGAYQQ